MAVMRDKPYPGMNFTVDLGTGDIDSPDAGLIEVIFPEARIQTFEYRNGNERVNEPRKIQGLTHYGNLVLKRGAMGSLAWYEWWHHARNGDPDVARTVVVQLLNEDHSEVVLTWRFIRALPTNYQFSALNAVVPETLIESLELAFERLEMA